MCYRVGVRVGSRSLFFPVLGSESESESDRFKGRIRSQYSESQGAIFSNFRVGVGVGVESVQKPESVSDVGVFFLRNLLGSYILKKIIILDY